MGLTAVAEVVYSPAPREVVYLQVDLSLLPSFHDHGHVSVKDVIIASKVLEQCPELHLNELTVGVFGKKVGLDHLVQKDDQVEIYRALRVDPKEARRLRFQKEGVSRSHHIGPRRAFK